MNELANTKFKVLAKHFIEKIKKSIDEEFTCCMFINIFKDSRNFATK